MCGRFAIATVPEVLKAIFGTSNPLPNFAARYNLAPTQDLLAVRFNPETRQRSLDVLRWGLIPHWSKGMAIGSKLINARAEGLAEKPSFRPAFKSRRCLIPADAFYEWKQDTKPKQPYAIIPAQGSVFAFAGLWENWQDPAGHWIRTATIITTTANEAIKPLHDRMPVMIAADNYSLWLGEEEANRDQLLDMLVPAPADTVRLYQVSASVSNVRNEGPELLAPV